MKNIIITGCALIIATFVVSCKKLQSIPTPTPTPTAGIDSLKVGLIAHYTFNNSVVDSSGRGNNGIAYGLTSTNDRNGKANGAYHFDGTTSYVTVPDNIDLRLNNTNITLSAWVQLDSYNASFGNNILTKHTVGNDNGWAWGITGSGYSITGVVTFGPGGTSAAARGKKVIGLNQWHMMTSTYNVSTRMLSIYIDGVFDTLTSNIPSPNAAINSMLYIGRDDPSTSVNGYMVHGALDDVRIYNRELSVSEIQKLYTYKY